VLLLQGAPLLHAQKPDRSHVPEAGPPPALKLPAIQHFTLTNGIGVVVLEKPGVPIVQVNLVIRGGAVCDPAGKSGLASMTASMMMEGAGARDALQLAEAIDLLGARIGVAAGLHTSGVELHTPTSRLDSALALMADITLRPAFSATDLERKRKERLTTLLQWRDQPPSLASVEFSHTLFGAAHPYGVPSVGNAATLRSFTPADLRSFHAAWFRAGNATFIVVGDVRAGDILKRLNARFGEWTGVANPVPVPAAPVQVAARRITLVDKPGAPQTEVRIGRIGAARSSGDYYPLIVLNTILGGSFTSRLNNNLREVHGYTYGAGSRFDFRPIPGPFLAASAVQTAVTDKALTEFMKELTNILEPVGDAELSRAKNYVALSYPADFQSIAEIADHLEELVVYGLPDDHFNRYTERILAVTGEDVLRVAKTYIDPAKVEIILVGDRAQIEAPVQALHLAPITVRTVDDVLGPAPVVEQ
jgi:predicted Zn-dependent peptidase